MRVFITALIMRVKSAFKTGLFRCDGEGGLLFLDHLAHFADAFGALGLTALRRENVLRTLSTGFDSKVDVASADAVTVTDVQGVLPQVIAENGSPYHRILSVQLIRKRMRHLD